MKEEHEAWVSDKNVPVLNVILQWNKKKVGNIMWTWSIFGKLLVRFEFLATNKNWGALIENGRYA